MGLTVMDRSASQTLNHTSTVTIAMVNAFARSIAHPSANVAAAAAVCEGMKE
jgi:hypothetical protein